MRPNTLSTLDLTSLRTAFSILASPSPLGGRRADDSSVFVPSEGDDPRFSQWMQLKPYVIACVCFLEG